MALTSTIKSGHPHGEAFVFEFKDEAEARGVFACDAGAVLTTLDQWMCDKAIVRINGQPDLVVPIATIRMMAEFEPIIELFFADGSLPPAVLKICTQRIEESGRWGIVRLRDERQVVMSSGMSGVLLSGVGIDEATQWRRPEFWHSQDLELFNQDWRQRLNEDGSNAMEYRYRIHKPNSSDPWEYYRSSYRLLKGENSLLYQVCTFVDRE